jgi:hypothetical protein
MKLAPGRLPVITWMNKTFELIMAADLPRLDLGMS